MAVAGAWKTASTRHINAATASQYSLGRIWLVMAAWQSLSKHDLCQQLPMVASKVDMVWPVCYDISNGAGRTATLATHLKNLISMEVYHMADKAVVTATVAPEPVTEASLLAQVKDASAKGDFKALAKVAAELVKFQKGKEAAELTAKQEALGAITLDVLSLIKQALQPLVDSGKLDLADGVWFTMDFAEAGGATCRLMRSATVKRTGGTGGGGKKFDVTTEDMLTRHGAEDYKDGMTFQAAWESNTDKNWRYAIRQALLKKDGLI